MNKDVLARLKGIKTLNDQPPQEFISTGCYALNRVISGDYSKGLPVGGLIQLCGDSSSGKTLFATTFLSSAQKEGWYCKLLDAENTFSKEFGQLLGVDPEDLLYSTPRSIEETFQEVEDTVKAIRVEDKETPIFMVIDSLAVLGRAEELEREAVGDLEHTDGLLKGKLYNDILKRMNNMLRKNRTTLLVINQFRTKLVSNPHQNPNTPAAGGKSLLYYLSLDMHTLSNKTSDVIKEDGDAKMKTGITGRIKINKNKVGTPYLECNFKVNFNKGLDPYYGLEEWLKRDGLMDISGAGRRSVGDISFKKDTISELLFDASKSNVELEKIRGMFGIELGEATNG